MSGPDILGCKKRKAKALWGHSSRYTPKRRGEKDRDD